MVSCDSISELKKLISLVASPLIVCDMQSQRIIFANDSAISLTAFDHHALENLSVHKLFNDESHLILEAIFEISQNSSSHLYEKDLKIKRKTGRSCDVHIAVSACLVEGKKFLIFTLQDLTEIKRQGKEREKLMEETARISKLADVGRLAAGMAHELNNPLAILMGYLENLVNNVRNDILDKESLMEDIVPVEKAAQRMSRVIGRMLAQMRDEKHVLRPMPLRKVIDEALGLLEGILAAQSVELQVDMTDDVWISGDATSIEQIITNIVTNASNALEGQKERRILIRSRNEKNKVHIDIWNNGNPIPLDVQEKLFTPFFTTKGVGEGTGLGLYMSYHIMEAHNGRLAFVSNKEQGTIFTLSFPQIAKPVLKASSHLLRALVVDDDTFFRKLICQKLQKLQFECVEARDGKEAIEILTAHPEKVADFDMILIDFKMPKIDGLQVISLLRPLRIDVPVVLISGSLSVAELRSASDKYDLFDCLSKPVQNAELEVLAEKILQRASLKKSG